MSRTKAASVLIKKFSTLPSGLKSKAAELNNQKAMQASAACHQRYKDLKSLVTDKIANCDQSVSLHEEYNKHIERMTDLVSMSYKMSLSLTFLNNKLECFK